MQNQRSLPLPVHWNPCTLSRNQMWCTCCRCVKEYEGQVVNLMPLKRAWWLGEKTWVFPSWFKTLSFFFAGGCKLHFHTCIMSCSGNPVNLRAVGVRSKNWIVGWQYHQWCCFLKTCNVRIESNFSKERGPVNVQDLCTWVVWPWLLFSCLSLNGHLALNFQTVISAPWVRAVESKIFIAFAIGRADFYYWLVTGRVRFKTLACFPASGWNHWKKYSLYFQG